SVHDLTTISGEVAIATLPEPVVPTSLHPSLRTTGIVDKVVIRPRSSRRLLLASTATVLIALVIIWFFFERQPTAIDSLAVLPFVNTDADPSAEYLADGMTESLINTLSQMPKIKVIGSGSVFRFKGSAADPQTVGRQLGVRCLLTGRIAHRGESLMISTELMDVHDGRHIWGKQYERRWEDILQVQEEIIHRITTELPVRLTDKEAKQLSKHYTENIEAYDHYVKGRHLFLQFTNYGFKKGVEHFEQAIALDPNYALAYAGIGYAHAY